MISKQVMGSSSRTILDLAYFCSSSEGLSRFCGILLILWDSWIVQRIYAGRETKGLKFTQTCFCSANVNMGLFYN